MTQPPISRGFHGRRPETSTERVPPGQHLASDCPVLSAGPTPHTNLESSSFSLPTVTRFSAIELGGFEALPQTDVKVISLRHQVVETRHALARRDD